MVDLKVDCQNNTSEDYNHVSELIAKSKHE